MMPSDAIYPFVRAGVALIASFFVIVPSGVIAAAQTQQQSDESDVSKWVTFTSRAGWKIKYPPDLSISSCRQCDDPTDPNVIVAISKHSGEVIAMVEPLSDKRAAKSDRQWLTDVARESVLSPKLSEEWTTIDGAPALVVINSASNSDRAENVYILHGLKTFAVHFPSVQDATIRALCLRMLSTFQFALQ